MVAEKNADRDRHTHTNIEYNIGWCENIPQYLLDYMRYSTILIPMDSRFVGHSGSFGRRDRDHKLTGRVVALLGVDS